MKTAELMPAFFYICDNCGQENLVRTMEKHMTPEEKEQMAKDMGMIGETEHLPDILNMGKCILAPSKVACKHCSTEYETLIENPFENKYDDEDQEENDNRYNDN